MCGKQGRPGEQGVIRTEALAQRVAQDEQMRPFWQRLDVGTVRPHIANLASA